MENSIKAYMVGSFKSSVLKNILTNTQEDKELLGEIYTEEDEPTYIIPNMTESLIDDNKQDTTT